MQRTVGSDKKGEKTDKEGTIEEETTSNKLLPFSGSLVSSFVQ